MAVTMMTALKSNSLKSLLLALGLSYSVPALALPVQETPEAQVVPNAVTYVRMRALDKITARISEVEFKLGEENRFGTLAITARYCRSTPPEEAPESYAFLTIVDNRVDGTTEKVFEGWMVASSPSITALEHAVYDVWVIGCKTVLPEATDGNT